MDLQFSQCTSFWWHLGSRRVIGEQVLTYSELATLIQHQRPSGKALASDQSAGSTFLAQMVGGLSDFVAAAPKVETTASSRRRR